MGTAGRIGSGALLAAALAVVSAPASAQEPTAPPAHSAVEILRPCLNQKERRALVESGAVLRLAAALHAVRSRVPGTLVRARLCRRPEGFVYVLTVLAHDGKVTHVSIDAVKGTFVGGV